MHKALTCATYALQFQSLRTYTNAPAKFMEATLIAAISNIHRFIDYAEARKNLISIERGQNIIALTPEQLKDPITTALRESRLSAIADGLEEFDTFMADQAHLLPPLITPITKSAGTGQQGLLCPEFGNALRRLPSKKEKGKLFWACFEHDKPVFLPDIKGKPGAKHPKTKLLQAPGPEEGCDKVMRRFESKKRKVSSSGSARTRNTRLEVMMVESLDKI